MARNLFGGTASDVAEDAAGVRVPGVTGTVWDGPTEVATQIVDLLSLEGTPFTDLVADEDGMIPAFYGPDFGPERLYVDFGGPRTAILATDVGDRLREHLAADDPHGDREAAITNVDNRIAVPGGIAPLDLNGLVPLEHIPAHGPQTAATVADLLSTNLFYIAHRGSGMEYPEHTMAAYDAVLSSGVKAIEISVGVTADGIPVCMHDPNLDRTTNATGPMLSWLYAGLTNQVTMQPAAILGQGWKPQPLPNLRDVLDRFMGRVVIFLEGKTNEATVAVQKMLQDYYPTASESVVWKAYYLSPTFNTMKSRGFTTWAYVDAGTTDAQMDAVNAGVDMWGVPHTMTEPRIAAVVARGKPVICWEVHRRSQRDRLVGLGVRGLMCAQYQWVTSASNQIMPRDAWATSTKAPGEMGRTYYTGTRALKFGGDGTAYMDVTADAVMTGSVSFATYPTNGYRITFDMMFEGVPTSTEHAGIAFGKPDDSTYQFGLANPAGGYHIAMRGSGAMQLYSHQPGVANGTQLGSTVNTAVPVAGQWMSFQVDLTPTQVKVTRTDVTPNLTITSTDTNYRGGYIHVSGGSVSDITKRPRWRNLIVTAL